MAMRSARNYPHLLAERLGARLTDLTVSGVTTATILRTPQRVLGLGFPPQVSGVSPDVDLVTVTAGGNDVNYLGSVLRAAYAGRLSEGFFTRRLGRRLGRVGVPRRRRAVVGAVLAVTLTLTGCSGGPPAEPGSTASPSAQPQTTHQSTTSAPTIPYFNSSLTPPISLSMPSWTAHVSADGSFGSVLFAEADCSDLRGKSPCAADQDLKLRVLSVTFFYPQGGAAAVTRNPSYADYVAHLDALATSGVARTIDRAPVTVGGRSAVVMSLSVLHDAPGAIACAFESDPAAAGCRVLVVRRGPCGPYGRGRPGRGRAADGPPSRAQQGCAGSGRAVRGTRHHAKQRHVRLTERRPTELSAGVFGWARGEELALPARRAG
jgi:hypothetical protein